MTYRKKFDHQSAYWIGVSVITKASDYVIFLIAFYFTNNITFSNLFAAIFSIFLNFNLHARMTFGQRKKRNAFWKYSLSTSMFLILETTLLIFSNKIGLDVRVIKGLTLFLFSILGVLILDRWVFKDHKPAH
jgi:putative flippase GtrA